MVDFTGDPIKEPTKPLATAILLGKQLNEVRCDNDRLHAGMVNAPKGTGSGLGNWTENLAKTPMETSGARNTSRRSMAATTNMPMTRRIFKRFQQ